MSCDVSLFTEVLSSEPVSQAVASVHFSFSFSLIYSVSKRCLNKPLANHMMDFRVQWWREGVSLAEG